MNIEEIKVGETYNVRVKVERIDEDGWLKVRTRENAISFILAPKELEAFSALPKYDPCRPFKVGDEVRYCAPDGRIYADGGSLIEHIKNRDFTRVIRDELPNGKVGVFDPFDEENPYYVPAHALKLVTPVEERIPYVIDPANTNIILKYDQKFAVFDDDDAAEECCEMLNEQYRKKKCTI